MAVGSHTYHIELLAHYTSQQVAALVSNFVLYDFGVVLALIMEHPVLQ